MMGCQEADRGQRPELAGSSRKGPSCDGLLRDTLLTLIMRPTAKDGRELGWRLRAHDAVLRRARHDAVGLLILIPVVALFVKS